MASFTPATAAHWQARAAALTFEGRAFIDGDYVAAEGGATFESVNPANGAVLTAVARCTAADVDRAVAVARGCFERGDWARQPPLALKKVLQRWAALIEAHGEELALLETLDMGKPIKDSSTIDIPLTARAMGWYGEAIDKVYDEIAPTGPDALGLITREPVGVVGVIVPWNFPLLMAAWKLAPALAAGNSVVLKPSEKSPLSALRLAALGLEAGLPKGVLNVVPGFGAEAGEAMARHMDVDCLAFTGSTATGKRLLVCAGESNMKRVWLECGGKTPNVVFADCRDLDAAAKAAAGAIFFNQGEVCTAGSRLLVDRRIKDQLLERVLQVGQQLAVGDPLDPATQMGAIVDAVQLQRVLRYLDQGRAAGARLVLGGEQVRRDSGGYFIAPTVFDAVDNGMTIAREEIFGPVLATIPFDDPDEALAIANDTPYGLAAALWTSDINKAHRSAQRLKAGTVWVNCFDESNILVPFGGFKQSGIGRDNSLHALEKYTELKSTWISLAP
ncbi:MAG: aldehyde dehydrogenase [Candidatus Competibacterales bacterium]